AELEALFIGVFAISAIHVLSWLRRYVRAWWAGITSLTFLFAVCTTVAALAYPACYTKTTVIGLVSLAAVIAIEYRGRSRRSAELSVPKIDIPVTKISLPAEQRWQASSSDDPITDWDEDIIGRTAVVE